MDLERVKMAAFFDEMSKMARAGILKKLIPTKGVPKAPAAPAGVQALKGKSSPIKLTPHKPATQKMPGMAQRIAGGGIGRQTALGFI